MTWRYFDYVTANERNPIQEWLAEQDDEVIAALNTVLYERKELSDWLKPPTKHARKQFKVLQEEHFGLAELRFSTTSVFTKKKRTFRVAGLFRATERTFVLFTGCEKLRESHAEVPPDAFDVAMEHKADLTHERGRLVDHK